MRIGVDLGGTKTELLALDADGAELFRERRPTPPDYEATLALIEALLGAAERATGRRADSVGLGMPGTSSLRTGLVKNANSTWLNGRPLVVDLQARLGRPVRAENDANCLAVSEATDGAAAGATVVFAAILGTGVGAGLALQGAAYGGPNGLAGEWGHNPLPWQTAAELAVAPACYCGRSGCVERWLSGPALSTHAAREDGFVGTAAELARSLDTDSAAQAAFERYVDRAARALAGVVNVLDPDIIVLGGGVSQLPGLAPRLTGALGAQVFGRECDTPVVLARHGDSSGIRGAAWLFGR